MNHKTINQLARIQPKHESLEADGSITVYSLGSCRVVAEYEGLEVHEAMQELAALRERVRELEAICDQATTDCIPLLSWVAGDDAAVEMVMNIANNLGAANAAGGE